MLLRDFVVSSCIIKDYGNSPDRYRDVLFTGLGGLAIKHGAQGKSTGGALGAIQAAYAVIRIRVLFGLTAESTIFMTNLTRITLGRFDL